jgi:hypothetical protein
MAQYIDTAESSPPDKSTIDRNGRLLIQRLWFRRTANNTRTRALPQRPISPAMRTVIPAAAPGLRRNRRETSESASGSVLQSASLSRWFQVSPNLISGSAIRRHIVRDIDGNTDPDADSELPFGLCRSRERGLSEVDIVAAVC